MAEHVFQNLEGMLPELEDLERDEIFDRDELRYVYKRSKGSSTFLTHNHDWRVRQACNLYFTHPIFGNLFTS